MMRQEYKKVFEQFQLTEEVKARTIKGMEEKRRQRARRRKMIVGCAGAAACVMVSLSVLWAMGPGMTQPPDVAGVTPIHSAAPTPNGFLGGTPHGPVSSPVPTSTQGGGTAAQTPVSKHTPAGTGGKEQPSVNPSLPPCPLLLRFLPGSLWDIRLTGRR